MGHRTCLRQRRGRRGDPLGRRAAIQPGAAIVQRAAGVDAGIGQYDPGAAARRCQGRHQPGGAGADDQQFAMPVPGLIAQLVRRSRRCRRQAGGPPDVRLKPAPVGPHKRFVVKRGRQQAGEQLVDAQQIELRRRPAIDRLCRQPRPQRHRGGRLIGGLIVTEQLDQRRRLFDAGADDASGPVVFEAARGQDDAVCQQRGRQRVAPIAVVLPAVEGETDALGAVDAPA